MSSLESHGATCTANYACMLSDLEAIAVQGTFLLGRSMGGGRGCTSAARWHPMHLVKRPVLCFPITSSIGCCNM